MKRYANLYEKIYSLPNLVAAAKKAFKNKKKTPANVKFRFNLEKEFLSLYQDLKNETYQPGDYVNFKIYEPKERVISAAPFRDRVVHHALMNIVGPILEKHFIFHTFANRKGKGVHAAIQILKNKLQNPEIKFVLKCDLKKYFPSIDLRLLSLKLKKRIKCFKTLNLINKILYKNFDGQKTETEYFDGDDLFEPFTRRRGLPLGNLTSQCLANYYLSDFDHFMKEKLKCRYYMRYVDDFIVLGKTREELTKILSAACGWLENERLRLHPFKKRIQKKESGIDFLGYVVYPTHTRVRRRNLLKFVRRYKISFAGLKAGTLEAKTFKARIGSWLGYIKWADTFNLKSRIFTKSSPL